MKIICVGRNYAAHAKELNNPVNESPVIFMKPETAIPIKGMPFFYPDFSKDLHHEVELVIKISKNGKCIEERFAKNYYEEVGVGIDFTARDLQAELKSKGLPWELAKAFDGSAPVSKKFLSKDEIPDLNNMHFSLHKNDVRVQEGNSALMIFKVDYLIHYVSQFISLKKGDLIFTGTPAGVGPVQVGDVLHAFIENEMMLEIKVK
ncbi:MAG: fumarylacetoacetate hydrolase family protein [Bacteroidetes bacterium]|nr:fumarylacetoacetate hydrolase family protein [Bacteroidota bacterium]